MNLFENIEIRTSDCQGIGDALLITPALLALKRRYPACKRIRQSDPQPILPKARQGALFGYWERAIACKDVNE
jgi:hypothetical protein